MKNVHELEKLFKGCASHRRMQIMFLIERRANLSVFDIADEVRSDFKNVAEHLRKLTIAGLVAKRRMGVAVGHSLTDLGKRVLGFCRSLE
ncbi:MAG: winged helix-turn-helix transcriptional regulator [Candidatus Pacebacteria bacterium]|nr:winged helix-turn-helix transcriptional regulator [Candidatus Paceibacterota bacterium]